MSPTAISQEEFAWRLWHLGEGDYKKYGRRAPAHRGKTGAPAKIPNDWWQRFEEFLARRNEDKEKPTVQPVYPKLGTGGVTWASEHFAIHEFDCHDGSKVPKPAYPALARLAAVFLEPLRSEFGTIYVTSGYRPKAYNASIGGAPQSQHIYELTPQAVAADLIPKIGSPAAWGKFLRRIANAASIGGVGVYPVSGFVHVDNGSRRDW